MRKASRRARILAGLVALVAVTAALFVGIVSLVLVAKLFVLVSLWILLPLGLPVLPNNLLALVLAGSCAYYGWRLLRFLLPRAGGGLDA